jgi:4-amino-4-deoxy-L-arabinose transferase-like glycosyltransferase
VHAGAPGSGAGALASHGFEWRGGAAVMALALVLRLVFYTGYSGSDEVTYTQAAFKLLDGDWSVSKYVGANRYGVNLPVAGFAWLFGRNEVAAALFSMLCSLGEVALVFHFGRQMLGPRAGLLAALTLVVLPIHVHLAGRLMADAPLGLAITASFLLFWAGESRNRSALFAGAGIAAGLVYWVKPHALPYLAVLIAYPIVFRRWSWKWAWVLGGFGITVAASNLFFWVVTGSPWTLFEALRARQTSGYLEAGTASASLADALYYPIYLFGKIYHTWLLAYLAVAAAVVWFARRRRPDAAGAPAVGYLCLWALGSILLFSLLVISWRPLLLIPKQTNYMLIFVAPLCLLAGYALARLRGAWLGGALALVLVPSVLLCGMQQNSIRVFTANSQAALAFARAHAGSEVFVNTNAFRIATFNNLVVPGAPVTNMRFIGDLARGVAPAGSEEPVRDTAQSTAPRYAVIDTQTLSWSPDEPITSVAAVPACWVKAGTLQPPGTGFGTGMLDAARSLGAVLPGVLRDGLVRKLDVLTRPGPAHVFELPMQGCALEKPGARRPP